jgi:hypothetical protein
LEVLWGEFSTGKVIFTLPVGFMKEIIDFEYIAEKFGIVVSGISQILGLLDVRPYRIVFDVDLPNDRPLDRFRLFFLESDMRQCFQFGAPSGELFEV